MRRVNKLVALGVSSIMIIVLGACSTTGKYDKSQNDAVLAQLPKTPTVTLSVKDTPVVSVLAMISKQTGIEVSVADEWLAGFPIKVEFKDATLAEVLAYLLDGLPSRLICRKAGGQIVSVKIIAPRGSSTDSGRQTAGPESFKIMKSPADVDKEAKDVLLR